MKQKRIRGIYAALLTPRLSDGRLDLPALSRLIEFLTKRDVRSYALNGATGEFCLTTPNELRMLFATIRGVVGDAAEILCGVGAAGISGAIELARIAQEEGSRALLAPTPYFFRYEQEDLEAFFEKLASRVALPVMLYNLPQFTTGLEVETACRLIRDVPNIIGIKDSSGSLDILRALTQEKIPACRVVGNDSVLSAALQARVCDGVVSGVACVVPELIQSVDNAADNCDSIQFRVASDLLNDFISRIDVLPIPWGLKWIAEERGILKATFSHEPSPHRIAQGLDLMTWYKNWQRSLPLFSYQYHR